MLLVGHRGARGEAPENTQTGFAYLRRLGINAVELDIQLSADNQLMVIHDPRLERTTNGQGLVSEWHSDRLEQLALPQAAPMTGDAVPRLHEVIAAWPELTHMQIELKTIQPERRQALIDGLHELLVQQIPQHTAELIITSSDSQLLALARQRMPHIPRGFIAQRFCRRPVMLCEVLDCRYLILNYQRCFLSTLRQAQQRGIHVSCWTVNSPTMAQKLKRWGVDSLITDYPLRMLNHFAGKNV